MITATEGDVVSITTNQGHKGCIDIKDWERNDSFCEFHDGFMWIGRISSLNWRSLVKNHTTYLTHPLPGGRELRIHRAVMGARAGQLIDHRDHNGLNNRRYNLRVATNAGNSANSRSQRGSKSKFKGVSVHKPTGKFEAYLRHNKKKHHLGLFVSEEDAAKAYDELATKIWGEFAHLNFPITTNTEREQPLMDDDNFDIDDLYIDIGGEGLVNNGLTARGMTPRF